MKIAATDDMALQRCGCGRCRRSAVASFAAYLEVDQALPEGTVYEDDCEKFGKIERVSCPKCRSKIGAKFQSKTFISAGCIDEVPESLAAKWRRNQPVDAAPWMRMPVMSPKAPKFSHLAQGGCACGACTFKVRGLFPGELQHCYCSICRKLSGGAFQSWMPARKLEWTSEPGALDLVRTTRHGRRHQCRRCGSVMTIIYDAQPDTPWPAAGAIDDDAFSSSEASIYRIIHICCETFPPWYSLPSNDTYPRLKDAC